MDIDEFQEVPDYELPNLTENLSQNWPQNFLLHQYLVMMNVFKNKNQSFQTLYRCGDTENGIYLIQSEFPTQSYILNLFFVYTASESLSNLTDALLQTNRIPWHSHQLIFEITMGRLSPFIGKAIVLKGMKAAVQHYNLLWLPPETKIDFPVLPEDVFIEYLNLSHVPQVVYNWPSFPGFDKFIEKEVLLNVCLGIFRKKDNRLLSSVLSFHSGGMFMLFTEPEFRRRRYGDILIRYMVEELRRQQRIPFCTVFPDNIPSQKLLRNIGFEDFDSADYIFPAQFLTNCDLTL